ncbi:MAG: cellulase family glycosylhydrolase [Ruminococcus sp.]|nr:cellulase family glycosylhydrolase [Ruminococcus sp.]
MKKIAKTTASLLSAAVMALSAAAGIAPAYMSAAPMAASAVDDTNDDWLTVKGSRIYDMNGNEVWLTGANWFGFNCTENVPHYLWSGDIDDMVREIADYGINVLRIPVSTELLYSWMIGEPLPIKSVNPNNDPSYSINVDLINPDGSVANSQQTFEVLLAKCKKYGIKMFIDIHSPESNNSGHNYGIWYGKTMTNFKDVMVDTDLWIETLAWCADNYKNDDTLIGFDLKNEPHSTYDGAPVDAIWDDSDAPNNWKKAAQDCADAILAKNPHALILIEGNEGFEGHGAWWGGNLRGVAKYPVTPKAGTSQIVYSPHDYGPIVSAQTWFNKDFDEQTLLDDYWYDTWAYLVDKDQYPLLIGEWGGRIPETVDEKTILSTPSSTLDDTEKNVKWLILLRNYMIKNHINHTFWCLNDDSGDTGGLWKGVQFNGATGTVIDWDTLKYSLFEPSLWQTATSGKYIGLDHQNALGKNGISLNDFYANYASTEGSNLDGGTKTSGQIVTTDTPSTTATTVSNTTTTQNVTTTSTVTTGSGSVMLGDAFVDSQISVADIVSVLQYAANKEKYHLSDEALKNADVNADGAVDAKDAFIIQKVDAGLIKQSDLPVKD